MPLSPAIRRRLPYLLAALGILGLDVLTKQAIIDAMPLYSSQSIIGGFFNLVHTRNTGIAFSMFADAGPFVRNVMIPLFSAAAVCFLAVYFWRAGAVSVRTNWALTLILSGAVANLYERLVYGYVVDFLDFYVGDYHWPAFNVADSSITIGAGLLLLDALLQPGERQSEAGVKASTT
jgi:signal peptidase II